MNTTFRAAASAGLLLTSGSIANATVDRMIVKDPASNDFDVLFEPVIDATELVSISNGSVYTGEGATLTISAILVDDQVIPLFSSSLSPFFQTQNLSQVTGNNFAPFASPQDVKGLRFRGTTPFSQPSQIPTTLLPAATVAAFATIPEPTVALCMAFGLLLLSTLRRRLA